MFKTRYQSNIGINSESRVGEKASIRPEGLLRCMRLQLEITRGVSHCVALPFTLRSILGQKKNYENSNISPCKNVIFKKKIL
jgi:hypothetical protein